MLLNLSEDMYYFAYGSNLSHKQMAERCLGSRYLGRAVLEGYKQVFDGYSELRKGAGANVVPEYGSKVVGGLYEVSMDNLDALDKFELDYDRVMLSVKRLDGAACEAITYLRDPLPVGEPSKEYLDIIAEGKKDCGIEL